MAFLRNLMSRRFHSLINTLHPATPHSPKFKFPRRPIASLPQTQDPVAPKPQKEQNKKPLSTLFIEALSGKAATGDKEEEEDGEGDTELKKSLRQLTEEVRSFKEKTKGVPKKRERRSLYAVFTNQPANVTVRTQKQKEEKLLREQVDVKQLSPDMVMFVQYLYENGYFKDVNFVKRNETFDIAWFESVYASRYIKFAARNFARDNQEIAKWLSGSALKQVAVFGCPSINRSSVFPAKRLRKFFEVPENTVCSKCMLQQSCKFVNQSVWKCDTNKLDLVIVMEIITSYALQLVHPKLVVSDQVNKSVSQLLKEVVKLSQTT